MRFPAEHLGRALAYRFIDPGLLELALTHRSAGGDHNERLEYLGDAILGFVVADVLYHRFPMADEGQLSRLRASLVRRETLAQMARALELEKYIRMGAGELRTGGPSRTSTLADAFEAMIGAVYLDGGYPAARSLLERLFAALFEGLYLESVDKDPKTRLQESMQAFKRPLPAYDVVEVSGDQHNQEFHVLCRLADQGLETRGIGSSRRRAEQDAAQKMLSQIHHG